MGRQRRSRAKEAAGMSAARQLTAEAASSGVHFQMASSFPPETGMGQDDAHSASSPSTPCWALPCPLSQVWGSGCCRIPSSYLSPPSTLQGPCSEGILLAQFGVTRVKRKRLAAESWDKGRKAAIETAASLPGRARLMPGDSHQHVGIPQHLKTRHSSPRKNRPAAERLPVRPPQAGRLPPGA